MPEYCPECENEIRPYLKTGEFKEVKEEKIILYQLYFCIHCKCVYQKIHDEYKFKPLIKKEIVNEIAKQ